ncbi:MAG TPA: cellulase family glycosylhydrolase [Prolixibacteraceae bacterium]|jgi:aryl-phospho-beta-D-glucosidase BglC (GH1 family)|nr:cellulase family glycosylhydrolase [Prolixibacteraceae bacterium]
MRLAKVDKPFIRRWIFAIAILFTTSASYSQLPEAQQIASKMNVGWNLGNTLEAICGENAWGNPNTTQRFIDSVKAAGFNTIRIPVAWFCHSDTSESVIDEDWLERVKEVVDYCINDSMYVVMNAHWDKGWLENRVNLDNQDQVNERQFAYWTQIATFFKDYDEHLLFAGANEPNVENATGMQVLQTYHQTFIDAVRQTGGNNASRTLIIQGPSTDIEKTNKLMTSLPTDIIENRLMLEVHYYTPYQFCLMEKDADWGKVFYYWGKDYHSKTDVAHNATWGEERDVEKLFAMMKTQFVDKGIPVILGEFLAIKRSNLSGDNMALHVASRQYFHQYVVGSAIKHGIIPYYWDTGDYGSGLFNRHNGSKIDKDNLDAIMQGAKNQVSTVIHYKNIEASYFPNPFTSTVTLNIDTPEKIDSIVISDSSGKLTEKIIGNQIKKSIIFGGSFTPGIYLVQIFAENTEKSFKIIKQ